MLMNDPGPMVRPRRPLGQRPHKQIHRKMQEAKCFTAGYLKQRDKERTKGAGAQQG